jgi:tRNA dimethylallyltransferase
LRELDPVAASRIHPHNVRRIVRALEVRARTGTPISLLQRERGVERTRSAEDTGAVLMVVLTLDRERLYARIDRRIDQQIAHGLVEEVRALLRSGYPRTLPALQGLGYAEIRAYLDGDVSFEEAVRRFRRNTRRYAKRQLTWFRADPRYVWVDVGADPPDVVAARIRAAFPGSAETP